MSLEPRFIIESFFTMLTKEWLFFAIYHMINVAVTLFTWHILVPEEISTDLDTTELLIYIQGMIKNKKSKQ